MFQRLVKEYLVQEKGSTVLMVTSQYKYLQPNDQQDYKVVMLKEGRVVQSQLEIEAYLRET